METDLDFYTRCMVEALQAARRTTSPEARRCYEQLARTFALQVHKVENTPTLVTPEPLRLRPLKLAA
jgi:hypothetical protein